MKKSLLVGLSLSAALISNAQAAEFGRPIEASIVTNQYSVTNGVKSTTPERKPVFLMNIKLTPQEKQQFFKYTPKETNLTLLTADATPSKIDTGMNNVPVLDQGQHGSCATFANTAAIDALLGKGDYVSQLCNLELGSYLEPRSTIPSGWEGSWGSIVLNQITAFGVVSNGAMKSKSCAGVSAYPANNQFSTGNPMTLDDFHQTGEVLSTLYWEPMLSYQQRMQWDDNDHVDAGLKVLNQVKQALATKQPGDKASKVTFGVLLPVDYCSAGACGRYHAANDTWAYTDAIKRDKNPNFGGHEMVITGYDDKAVATDDKGKKHTGLLTLRNSWGTSAGDKGNYYMTYEFFEQYVLEAQRVALAKE